MFSGLPLKFRVCLTMKLTDMRGIFTFVLLINALVDLSLQSREIPQPQMMNDVVACIHNVRPDFCKTKVSINIFKFCVRSSEARKTSLVRYPKFILKTLEQLMNRIRLAPNLDFGSIIMGKWAVAVASENIQRYILAVDYVNSYYHLLKVVINFDGLIRSSTSETYHYLRKYLADSNLKISTNFGNSKTSNELANAHSSAATEVFRRRDHLIDHLISAE
ncbi:hypothetical protein RF11_10134 [Thelohanellus kitauei]|uniref:Uncharacterized protein n=1 Tax=Thelohanellus kitauei TaxID=669202 RepID=A0A0C2IKT4_THEKT|nr:hypothetical protein RF11_10134 [Thelohanellus kitauei]